MSFHDPLAYTQAKSIAAGLPRTRTIDSIKWLEEIGNIGFRYTGTVIRNAHDDSLRIIAHEDLNRTAIWQRELAGILQQVPQHGFDLLPIHVQQDFGWRQ